MLKLYVIKTKSGYYFTDNLAHSEYYERTSIPGYNYDGIKPEKSFHKLWYFLKNKPKVISKTASGGYANERYELRDPVQFPSLQKVYAKDEVVLEDTSCETTFKDFFIEIRSLYDRKTDKLPDVEEEKEFEWIEIMECEGIPKPTEICFTKYKTEWKGEGLDHIKNENVKRFVLDDISTPQILRHTKPSRLTSKQSYDIIRYHILENINGKYAKVTSDYDFCFTVEKIVDLHDPYQITFDANYNPFSKRKKKPKYEKRMVNERRVKIFEMTHKESNYEGYTPIEGFEGKTEEDLKKNVDDYLKELMDFINSPVKECPKCGGTGVICEESK